MHALRRDRLITSLSRTGLALFLCFQALAVGHVQAASAAAIVVTTTSDSLHPAKCSLRDAITAANTNTATGGCPAGSPGLDQISFSINELCIPGLCRQITLQSPLPQVTEDLTINGSPSGVTISGADLYPVFDFGVVVASLSNLTIIKAKGDFGGGIIVDGANLTLSNVQVSNCHAHSAAAIYEISGSLHVNKSRFLDNATESDGFGGAIGQDSGITVISNSTFTNNTAGIGGAIGTLANSNLDLSASVFDGNNASIWGGAVYLQDATVQAAITGSTFTNNHTADPTVGFGGGAIFINLSSLTLARSTFANNTSASAGGALYVFGATVTLSNVTVSGNTAQESGGGIFTQSDGVSNPALLNLNNVTLSGNTADVDQNNTGSGGGLGMTSGTINILNSILAGNFDTPNNAGAGTIHPDCSGIYAGNFNLIGRNDGCVGFVNGINGNRVGTPGSPIKALLAPLANNGGATQTRALLPGSPAYNAGSPAAPGAGGSACEPIDQRGILRPLGSTCDMGAFEAGSRVFLPSLRR